MGWQATHAGEREVKKALRQTLFRYKLHQDAELFDRAYGYAREYFMQPMDVRLFVGRNIARVRRERGMTQAALAAAMDIDRAYISGLERGNRNPTVMTLWRLASLLGVEVGILLAPEPDNPYPTTTASDMDR